MNDLTELQSALQVKIVGSDSTGLETYEVNADTNGNLLVKPYDNGSATGGTAAALSSLSGGIYNSILPVLSTTNQCSFQLDSNSRLINAPLVQSASGSITSISSIISCSGAGSVYIQVLGTWVGTIVVTGTIGGSGYGLWLASIVGSTPTQYTYSNITTNGIYKVLNTSAFNLISIQATSWTSGTANIIVNSGAATGAVEVVQLNASNLLATVSQPTASLLNAQVVGNVADGAVDSGNTIKVGGVYNTSLPTYSDGQRSHLQTDINGKLLVSGTFTSTSGYGTIATYSAGATFTVASSPTYVFTITGSASKTVRILYIEVSSQETTAATLNYNLILRSTANTGGTSTAVAIGEHDTTNSVATAIVRAYTANPTLGTLHATIRTCKWTPATPGTAGGNVTQMWDLNKSPGQPVTLRGTSQVLSLNLGGLTQAGNSYNVSVCWTEE
jgi:hypothetical protein